MTPISDQSSVVPVERTAVPADPLWPRVVAGRCTWCGDPGSEHEGGVREHHRIEVLGGRYDDEPEIARPGLPAPVHPQAPGVSDADLVAVIAARLAGCVTPTASGWVKLAAVAVGEQLVLTVTTWGPLSAGMAARVVDRTVALGEPTVVSRDEPGAARPGRPGGCARVPGAARPSRWGPVMACDRVEPLPAAADTADAERRVLDVVRDVFAVLDAGGYRRTSDDAALGRAVWALVDEYEGHTGAAARRGPDG